MLFAYRKDHEVRKNSSLAIVVRALKNRFTLEYVHERQNYGHEQTSCKRATIIDGINFAINNGAPPKIT